MRPGSPAWTGHRKRTTSAWSAATARSGRYAASATEARGSPRWPIGSQPDAEEPLQRTFRWRIEIPHGPVVESLKLDRFRDRHSPAGAKDDSLDARVLADALRTDLHHFRRIDLVDPVVIELRAWSRIDEELTRDRTRLSNRVREQLWRYYPQIRCGRQRGRALGPRPLGQGSDAREGPARPAPDP